MKSYESYETEEQLRELKHELLDRAYNCEQAYKIFKDMGRLDLANEKLEALSQLEGIITFAGLEKEYKSYSEYAFRLDCERFASKEAY